MKTMIFSVVLLWAFLIQSQAYGQQDLNDLVTEYNALSQEADQTKKKNVQRKQDRVAVKLVNYIQEYGYPLTVSENSAEQMVVYTHPDPTQAKVLEVLKKDQLIQVYDKDAQGYYKVTTEAGDGYVKGLSSQFGQARHPLMLLDEMLSRRLAVDKMLEESREQPRMRFSRFGNNNVQETGL